MGRGSFLVLRIDKPARTNRHNCRGQPCRRFGFVAVIDDPYTAIFQGHTAPVFSKFVDPVTVIACDRARANCQRQTACNKRKPDTPTGKQHRSYFSMNPVYIAHGHSIDKRQLPPDIARCFGKEQDSDARTLDATRTGGDIGGSTPSGIVMVWRASVYQVRAGYWPTFIKSHLH